MHKHWCDGCNGYWEHDDADCGGPIASWSWPCPEHADHPESWA